MAKPWGVLLQSFAAIAIWFWKHQENGNALYYASAEFRGGRDMVLEAVRQHRHALPPASAELCGDQVWFWKQ